MNSKKWSLTLPYENFIMQLVRKIKFIPIRYDKCIKNMLKEKIDINIISKVTGLSIDEINELIWFNSFFHDETYFNYLYIYFIKHSNKMFDIISNLWYYFKRVGPQLQPHRKGLKMYITLMVSLRLWRRLIWKQ